MADRIQIVSIVGAAILLLVIFDLVRRRRLLERYAILWLGSGVILLGLAVWRGALENLASALGIFYPPNALFVVAFGFVLVLLLHFSIAVSKLADQSKVLAQRLALLEQRVDSGAEGGADGQAGAGREPHDERSEREPHEPLVSQEAAEAGDPLGRLP
jgi:hypothetical protein